MKGPEGPPWPVTEGWVWAKLRNATAAVPTKDAPRRSPAGTTRAPRAASARARI